MLARRVLKLGVAVGLFGMAACTAIAGLDGRFEDGSLTNDGGGSSSSGADAPASHDDGSVLGTDAGTDARAPDADAGPPVCVPLLSADAAAIDATTADVRPESCGGGKDLCWNFDGDPDASPWGWQVEQDTAGGATVVEGTNPSPPRRLHVTVPAKAPLASSQGLLWTDWNTNVGGTQDLPIGDGESVRLDLNFQLTAAGVAATIAGFRFGTTGTGGEYGLALYPDPCGGPGTLAQTGLSADGLTAGAVAEVGVKHHLTVRITRRGVAWDGTVTLDGTLIGARNGDAFANGNKQNLEVLVGLFNLTANDGPGSVFIDDVTVLHEVP